MHRGSAPKRQAPKGSAPGGPAPEGSTHEGPAQAGAPARTGAAPTQRSLTQVRSLHGRLSKRGAGVDREGAARAGLGEDAFAACDANLDGLLSRDEFVLAYHRALADSGRRVGADLRGEATRLSALSRARRAQAQAPRPSALVETGAGPAGARTARILIPNRSATGEPSGRASTDEQADRRATGETFERPFAGPSSAGLTRERSDRAAGSPAAESSARGEAVARSSAEPESRPRSVRAQTRPVKRSQSKPDPRSSSRPLPRKDSGAKSTGSGGKDG